MDPITVCNNKKVACNRKLEHNFAPSLIYIEQFSVF